MADHIDDDREVEELLPWYVNGTLTDEEAAKVRRHIQGDEQAAVDVEFLRHVRDAVKSEEFGSPGEFGLRRLRAAINEEAQRAAPVGGPEQWWRPAAIAAVLVVAVQAVLLVDAWQQGGVYEPAGVETTRPAIQLRFDPAATEADIRDLLNELDVEIVGGPGGTGVYRVSPVREGADMEKLAGRLRDSGRIVDFAEIE